MREFTNENLCLSRGIWVNFLCLLSEYLSIINPINESNISLWESILRFLGSNFGFWDSILSICKLILGISELLLSLWESVLGLWESTFRPLGVVFFLCLGFDFGFLGIRFWCSGVYFGTLWALILEIWEPILELWESFLALKVKCMPLSFDIVFIHQGVDFGPLGRSIFFASYGWFYRLLV